MRKPDYTPVHTLPVWLSSEDVKQVIVKLAKDGAEPGFCWDAYHDIEALIEQSRANPTQDKGA